MNMADKAQKDYEELQNNDICWIAKKSGGRGGNKTDSDVSISCPEGAKAKREVDFVFRHHRGEVITERGYLQVGICGDRICFRQSGAKFGHKVSTRENPATSYVKICVSPNEYRIFKEFVGDYKHLHGNDLIDYHYINKEEREKG